MVPCRSLGIQTSDVIRTLFTGELMPLETICMAVVTDAMVLVKAKSKNERDAVVTKERASQTA